jgi:hypothetical protein
VTYLEFPQFEDDQRPGKHTIIHHTPEFDLDYKCPVISCKTYCSEPYIMGEHIQKKHKNYRTRNILNLPIFCKFLRLNAKERKGTEFYGFLKLCKHPWLNTPILGCVWCSSSYKCQKIFSTRAVHDDHPGVWYHGYQVVIKRTREGTFHMISKGTVRPFNEIEVIDNPNVTISHNEKKQMLDRIQYLINNEPDNEEIKMD